MTVFILVKSVETQDFTALKISSIVIWTAAGILSESLSVYYVNGTFYISPIEAVFCGCYLSCGPLAAAICIVLTFLFNITKNEKKYWHILNTAPRYMIFNIFHHILIMLVLHRFIGVFSLLPFKLELVPAVIIAPLFFTLSCLINALLYKIEDGESFQASFKDIFDPYYQTAFPASFAAVIIAKAYPVYGFLSIVIMLVPLLVTILSFRNQTRGDSE